jgi:hypothetical protein
MLGNNGHHVHQHERIGYARQLFLTLEKFDRLVDSANHAYEVLKELGPFYGREDIKEPTFRITAEPVPLPIGSEELLQQFGNDLLQLSRALSKLPQQFKDKLGEQLDFTVPLTWRIDAIINEQGGLQVNEVEGRDGASALMMAEQFAYGLQPVAQSTAAKLISTIKTMCKSSKSPLHLAYIRVDNPHKTNGYRFNEFIEELSGKTIRVEHMFDTDIKEGIKLDWSKYNAVLNESSLSTQELLLMGVTKEQILPGGVYNALINKGLFALVFEPELAAFWKEEIGEECLKRLQHILIPTEFVTTKEQLRSAHAKGKVVKVSWAGNDTTLINRSQGVALPEGTDEHSSDDRWQMLEVALDKGATIIAQDYVRPQQVDAYLRKKGINLELVHWYNRVCVKYVCEGDSNVSNIPSVALTATEVTLGPDVIPAGRKCAFTAGKLQ